MAYDDDIIRKNLFTFSLVGVLINDTKKREALSPKHQRAFMEFVKEDPYYRRYCDMFNVLLGTGMRISEFCGLTIKNLDFENRKIFICKQLIKEEGGAYHVGKTKTTCGERYIPMTDEVYENMRDMVKRRPVPKRELIVGGCTKFLTLDRNANLVVSLYVENYMGGATRKYRKTHKEYLPPGTPHIMRHTFCTNMANAGMDLKSLQYIMGHSEIGVTLNVYTHAGFPAQRPPCAVFYSSPDSRKCVRSNPIHTKFMPKIRVKA